jgi:hypothetical protein
MAQGFASEYIPNAGSHKAYMKLYEEYKKLGKFSEGK